MNSFVHRFNSVILNEQIDDYGNINNESFRFNYWNNMSGNAKFEYCIYLQFIAYCHLRRVFSRYNRVISSDADENIDCRMGFLRWEVSIYNNVVSDDLGDPERDYKEILRRFCSHFRFVLFECVGLDEGQIAGTPAFAKEFDSLIASRVGPLTGELSYIGREYLISMMSGSPGFNVDIKCYKCSDEEAIKNGGIRRVQKSFNNNSVYSKFKESIFNYSTLLLYLKKRTDTLDVSSNSSKRLNFLECFSLGVSVSNVNDGTQTRIATETITLIVTVISAVFTVISAAYTMLSYYSKDSPEYIIIREFAEETQIIESDLSTLMTTAQHDSHYLSKTLGVYAMVKELNIFQILRMMISRQ